MARQPRWHSIERPPRRPRKRERPCLAEFGLPKVKYATWREANDLSLALPPLAGVPAQPYRCPVCGLWHVGRMPARQPRIA